MQLRPYQSDLFNRSRLSLFMHKRTVTVSMTGSGKTVIATEAMRSASSKDKRIWFVVHRTELIRGTSRTLAKAGVEHGIVGAGYVLKTEMMVQIVSIGSIKKRMALLPSPDAIILDECHHATAKTWLDLMAAYPMAYIWGLTATPCRTSGSGLGSVFRDMVIGPSMADLIAWGNLSPFKCYGCPAPDLQGVGKTGGDYNLAALAKATDKPSIVSNIVQNWKRLADGMKTIGFAVNVEHSKHLVEAFQTAGVPAAHIDGCTRDDERAQIIDDFADGRYSVLWNCNIMSEGFDLSAVVGREVTVEAAILARPTASLSLHLQQCGRALRPAPGKVAVLMDCSGNLTKHGWPDEPHEWTLDGVKRKEGVSIAGVWTCIGCYNMGQNPKPLSCPYCGHVCEVEARKVAEKEAELVELKRQSSNRSQVEKMVAAARTHRDLLTIAKACGYNPRWAWVLAKKKGFWVPK